MDFGQAHRIGKSADDTDRRALQPAVRDEPGKPYALGLMGWALDSLALLMHSLWLLED
jgi:hypothetical protein